MIENQKFSPGGALNVATQIHTSPGQFGKVMSTIQPRLAVGYHFFNDFDTAPLVYEDVRKTWKGPLALAVDYMVFNVTKDHITTRMAAIDEDIWPQPATIAKIPPDRSKAMRMTDLLMGGRVNYSDIVKEYYDDINKKLGTKVPYPPGVE
jgi:ribonuclease Z